MEIPVKLEKFEGPLDLLLHLIEKNKVSIYDIPIALITDQYMEYVAGLSGETLDVMSEFLVMAATLLDIKSRMLLPAGEKDEDEEADPREELVQKLLEYKMYKYMSGELRDCMEDAAGHYYKEPSIPPEVETYREPVDVDTLLGDLTLQRLYAVFRDIMKRQENRIDPVRSRFGRLKKEEVNLGETMRFVSRYIFEKKNCMFYEILSLRPGKQYKIVTFLTLLELMKEGQVEVEQPETFSDIRLSWTGSGEENDIGEIAGEYE
ncbi:MAG: segregation/condensation protein A [Lachnospiraceae bacterium]|nr:segregation/condensation protein A [Lachnospiraceae bacterium]